jgi:S-adenosylmethionine-dependent methyltransferase
MATGRLGSRAGSRATLRTAVVWELLIEALGESAGKAPLDVVDAGGGTGGFAVPLAELGHRVTVVDPSPDSLAALERRADLVLCHSVLEVVDDPLAAVSAVAQVLRPGGLASVLAANRSAIVIGRALAGRFDEAARALEDAHGRFADTDVLARRFSEDELVALLATAGLQTRTVHGVRVFSDLVPGALLDSEPAAASSLLALEEKIADRAEYRPLAAQLHVLAVRR